MERSLKVDRYNYESEFFYTLLIIGFFIFLSSFALFKAWGYRPVCFFTEENGVIVDINDDQMFNLGRRRRDIKLERSCIYLEGKKNVFIYRKHNLKVEDVFSIGQQVKLLTFMYRGHFFFVRAKDNDGEDIIPYNSMFGNLNFIVMLLSGFVTLSVFTLQTYQKRNRSIKRKKIS